MSYKVGRPSKMWKLEDFTAINFLREINLRDSRSSGTLICTFICRASELLF